MPIQEGIPKEQQATQEQEWPFTIWEFLLENKWYFFAIFLIVAIFLYSRNYMKKH